MDAKFWKDKSVLVTGWNGFLGRHLVKALEPTGAIILKDWHCLLDPTMTSSMLTSMEPHIVIHLAATVGGIGFNQLYPADLFHKNMMMGLNVIHSSWEAGVDKVVVVGTTCAYPKFTPVPFKESDLWAGYPEETNAPYGVAKRALLTMCQAYRQQYGLNAIYLLPANLYGPGDHFEESRSHVIPAMIRKFVEAQEKNEPSVTLWGDGSPTREFLYVKDAVEGIILAAERYDEPGPVNLGTGYEVNTFYLARAIAGLVGFKGNIVWDTSKPNGQPRRCLDTSIAQSFGFEAQTDIYNGLRDTIDWYKANRT